MNFNGKVPRRNFLKNTVGGTVTLGTGLALGSTFLQSFSAEAEPNVDPHSPTADTEKEFRMKVIGPAELSKAASQIAVDKATNKNAKEFAGFELTEAIAVTTTLKDLGTAVPPMDAKATATLEKIKSAGAGKDFDTAFIQAQLENHQFLRDLAQDYVGKSAGKTSPAESQGRHLATLALAVFKEHVAITTRILSELGS